MNKSKNELFKEYNKNNSGIFYKTVETKINGYHRSYDIYWGDPNIVFDDNTYPLAVTIIPHRYNLPDTKIFLHDKFTEKYGIAFEMVVIHEVGHIFLHDVVGFNNPSTNNFMSEKEGEIWADYFSYCFFRKYRKINNLDDFIKIILETDIIKNSIYNIPSEKQVEFSYSKHIEYLKIYDEKINHKQFFDNDILAQMLNAIEITLDALGDIFKK